MEKYGIDIAKLSWVGVLIFLGYRTLSMYRQTELFWTGIKLIILWLCLGISFKLGTALFTFGIVFAFFACKYAIEMIV